MGGNQLLERDGVVWLHEFVETTQYFGAATVASFSLVPDLSDAPYEPLVGVFGLFFVHLGDIAAVLPFSIFRQFFLCLHYDLREVLDPLDRVVGIGLLPAQGRLHD